MKAGSAVAHVMLSLALIVPAAPASAGSREIFGYSGYLGEWELTATVTEDGSSKAQGEYSGPFSMKHVGLCTQDGPEEKKARYEFRSCRPNRALRPHYGWTGSNAAIMESCPTSIPEPWIAPAANVFL